MNGATKETFKEYSTDAKLDTLFDYVHNIYALQQNQPAICRGQVKECAEKIQELEKKINNQKLVNGSIAAGTGLVGGFAAMLAKMGLFK